ncbi:methyl-CpG-binding domain protein 3 isoform X1 [Hyaena hyaena]|uniref:methyl-CpG-binding domain protein 3 isoform X1 n=1 Tax=Hyaena hyaena TaxID=95912 RepID=UPI0019217D08|nr:methyl-CpG-binding domain protein 3 isoform X1 [Hyaena hyaena]
MGCGLKAEAAQGGLSPDSGTGRSYPGRGRAAQRPSQGQRGQDTVRRTLLCLLSPPACGPLWASAKWDLTLRPWTWAWGSRSGENPKWTGQIGFQTCCDSTQSPSGKKFRSKPQLARYLGGSMDLSTFDFRTGKLLMSKMNKSRQRVRYDSSSQVKGKPDLNTALPVRQTASIFKQPVTKITNHPSNKVKSDPQKAVEQPRQLFWEKKLSGLNAFDIAEELVKTMDLPKGLQGVGPGCTDETLLSALASALHTSTMPITGQLSAAVEKNPGVWLNTAQPLCKAFMVTDEDIRKQEELVQQVRKRLEEALMADMLAHVEELARDGDAALHTPGADEGDEGDEEDEEAEPEQDEEAGPV